MIQLQIISGKQAGLLWESRRFPVRVGRAADADLRLEDEGVWENHFQLDLDRETGFHITAPAGVLLSVNQAPVETARLRNSDIITAGAVQISFRLSPTRQRSLRLREALVWVLLLAVTIGQLALVLSVLR
ncbi:MAG: FHA domain-containing protein [Verrucomicrobiota bacterium]